MVGDFRMTDNNQLSFYIIDLESFAMIPRISIESKADCLSKHGMTGEDSKKDVN